jgi:hypothetical protein
MRYLAGIVSIACLAGCLVAPMMYFQGVLGEPAFKWVTALASMGWFVFATLWATRGSGSR